MQHKMLRMHSYAHAEIGDKIVSTEQQIPG
jgi:hypothetical protein